jgi:recombination endonuclease VII
MTEDGLCKNGDGKPVHCKDECQPCYRRTARLARGLKKPGRKPDPTKPYSRYNPGVSHHLPKTVCKYGHLLTDDRKSARGISRCQICLECEGLYCRRGHERTEENTYWWKGTRHCRECGREDQKWYAKKAKYGLSYDDILEMLDAQDYCCKLCSGELTLHGLYPFDIDHDHACCPGEFTCGKCVRGILHRPCNRNLNDSIEWHIKAIQYLENWNTIKEETNV